MAGDEGVIGAACLRVFNALPKRAELPGLLGLRRSC
jgi:hypothetical protein